MLAKLMPHLNVGAQKWMVFGPAGWFQNASRRWPSVGAAEDIGAAGLRRACRRAEPLLLGRLGRRAGGPPDGFYRPKNL